MRVEQSVWTVELGWQHAVPPALPDAQLVIVFGSPAALERADLIEGVRQRYPSAAWLSCSTAGEIVGRRVLDGALTVTACEFEDTRVVSGCVTIDDFPNSRAAGLALARAIGSQGPSHVLVMSDGLRVNGSELIEGMIGGLPSGVTVTGGLSGDGPRFQRTLVCDGRGTASGRVTAIGLIGSRLRVTYGSMGGWDRFGPERVITRASGNVLYELDGQPALALYKRYLAEHAANLPASALLFPLSIWPTGGGESVVRTVLAVDEAAGSMTFAGDVPQGHHARLMRANLERLIDGAQGAAAQCAVAGATAASPAVGTAQLALLISCVGRKLLLRHRIDEEVEAVSDALGEVPLTGFYSYGEICPLNTSGRPALHNQTMTITTLSEV